MSIYRVPAEASPTLTADEEREFSSRCTKRIRPKAETLENVLAVMTIGAAIAVQAALLHLLR